MKINFLLIVLFSCLLTFDPVFADSDSRAATDTEMKFSGSFYERARNAFAGWKTDWVIDSQADLEVPDRVTVGIESSPWYLDAYQSWKDEKAKEAENLRIADAVPEMVDASLIQDSQNLASDMEKYAIEAGKAAEAGDFQKMQEIQKKMEALAAPAQRKFEDHEKKVSEKIGKLLAKDLTLEARISLNKFVVDFERSPHTSGLSNGLTSYRTGEGYQEGQSWIEGISIVVLGNGWKLNLADDMAILEMPEPENFVHTKGYSLVIEVQAEKKRAESFLNSLPWNDLKSLLSN